MADAPNARKSFIQRFGWAISGGVGCLLFALVLGAHVSANPFTITYTAPTAGLRQFGSGVFIALALAIFVAIGTREVAEKASLKREESAHERFQAQARSITEASTRTVARNLWGDDHATEVFEEIVATNFSSHILREDYLHEYTFEPVRGTSGSVQLKSWVEYTTFNPAKTPEYFEPVFAADNTFKLYPGHPYLKPPTLTAAKIGDRVFLDQEIKQINEDMYGPDIAFELKSATVPLGTYKMMPGERIRVRLTFESIVPVDNQWIQMVGVPTKGLTVVVHNKVGADFIVFVAPLFRGGFAPQDNISADGRDWERRYDGVILPHSGWTTRWNRARSWQKAQSGKRPSKN